jgi:hypothetical protein
VKPRLWLLANVLIGFPVYLWWQGGPSSADTKPGTMPASGSSPVAPHALVGAGSCAAAACHNGNFAHGGTGSEYKTWITRDPHAKAYEVLFADAAKGMQKHLKRPAPAHEDRHCLQCHVAPGFDLSLGTQTPYLRTDGVSCESCHGPAQKWLNVHHLDAWKQMDRSDKKSRGMNDTQSLLGRAQVCAACHIGTPGADVDHDLIAAGHPRLHFEFAAFHAYMPRHWPDAKDRAGRPDFEAQTWAVGQLVTAQAALELLAGRAADPAKPWPEFAEHDCLSCHHDLRSPSWRHQLGFGKRKPGALPWHGHASLIRRSLESRDGPLDAQLFKYLDNLQTAFDAGKPDRRRIAQDARTAADMLKLVLTQWERTPPRENWVDQLQRSILRDAPDATNSWDEVTRIQLALMALQRARRDMKLPGTAAELSNPLAKLDLPSYRGFGRLFEPAAIRNRLTEHRVRD